MNTALTYLLSFCCPLSVLFHVHSLSVFSFSLSFNMPFFFIHVTLFSLHFHVIFLAWSFCVLFVLVSSCNCLSLFSFCPFVSLLSSQFPYFFWLSRLFLHVSLRFRDFLSFWLFWRCWEMESWSYYAGILSFNSKLNFSSPWPVKTGKTQKQKSHQTRC